MFEEMNDDELQEAIAAAREQVARLTVAAEKNLERQPEPKYDGTEWDTFAPPTAEYLERQRRHAAAIAHASEQANLLEQEFSRRA